MRSRNRAIKLLGLLQVTFLALLVLRSLTEAFSGLSIYLGPTTVNLSVAVVLLMDLVGLIYLGLLWSRGEWVIDRVGGFLIAWVLCLAPWVYIAASKFGIPGLAGVREWIRLLSLVLLYFVVLAIARRTNYERIINVCLLALPVPLAVTYYQIIFSAGEASSVGFRAMGTMVHPNNLAAFLVVMIVLTIWKLARDSHSVHPRFRKFLWGGLLILELPALIAPISSNGWLMFGVFLLTLAFVARGKRFKIMAVSSGVLLLILFVFIFSQNINVHQEIMQNLKALGYQSPRASITGGSLERRFRIWDGLIGVWRAHPIRGYGLNTTYFVNPDVGMAAHNDFLRYLVEGGIFGLLLFVLFQIAVGRELFRLRRQASDPQRHLLIGIGFSLFVAWAVGSIGDNVIAYTAFQVYFWALLAAISVAASTSAVPHQVEGFGRSRRWSQLGLELRLGRWASVMGQNMNSYAEIWLAPTPKEGKGGQHTRCPRCQTPALTPGDTFCRRCFAPLLASGSLSSLILLIFLFIGGIGFYLWNQGAGLETFFVGWLLLYVLLVTLLRNQRSRYIYALLGTATVGLITAQWLFQIPERNFQSIVWLSIFSLLVLGLYGLAASWWAVSRLWGRSLWQTLPAWLLALGLLSWGAQMVPKPLYPGTLYLFNYQLTGDLLWDLRGAYLAGGRLPVPLPELLGGLTGLVLLGLAIQQLFPPTITIRTPTPRWRWLQKARTPPPYLSPGGSLNPLIQVLASVGLAFWNMISWPFLIIIRGLQSLLRMALILPEVGLRLSWQLLKGVMIQLGMMAHSFIGIAIFYARCYLIPLGALFAVAYTLNFVLQETSAFIYGEPIAFGYILAGLLALFAELGLFIWGITGERLGATLRSLAISYGSVLALVQIAVLVSAGILWTMAKLLPIFSATERFAPLLLERPLGLYTWVTLGLMVLMAASYTLFRERFGKGEGRSSQLQDRVGPRATATLMIRGQDVDTNIDITDRMQQVIEAHPEGLTLPEIGELLGRDWRGLIIHIRELVDKGVIRKKGGRYLPKGRSSPPGPHQP